MNIPLPIISGVIIFSLLLGIQTIPVNAWQDERLVTFLTDNNRESCIMINKVEFKQGDNILSFYDHVENEDRYRQLNERPILKKSNPIGPFARGQAFTVLVDRDQPLTIILEIEKIVRSKSILKKNPIRRVIIDQLVVRIKPLEKEEIILKREKHHFKLSFSTIQQCGEIIFEVRETDERHQLKLTLIGKNKPVTIRQD